jgi:hypothetical protein
MLPCGDRASCRPASQNTGESSSHLVANRPLVTAVHEAKDLWIEIDLFYYSGQIQANILACCLYLLTYYLLTFYLLTLLTYLLTYVLTYLLTYLLIYSVVHSPFREANRFLSSLEIPRVL